MLDLSCDLVLPGLVNTHHHFYQTLTRVVPAAQDANLFNWLKTLYPIWARLRPWRISSSPPRRRWPSWRSRAAPQLRITCTYSRTVPGSTTRSQPPGKWACASRLRVAPCRWVNRKAGSRQTRWWISEESILRYSQRLIESYHDPRPGAFVQIVLAPCSPFSVTGELMKQSARLARE